MRATVATCLMFVSGLTSAGLVGEHAASAQELRIYTCVRQPRRDPVDPPRVVSRSLTLFHAGKVYDYIEAARELTVYNSAAKTFDVLQEDRQLATSITQDEIRHFLGLAEEEARHIIEESKTGSAREQQGAARLQFQIKPQFDIQFDSSIERLTLKSKTLTYVVDTTIPVDPAAADAYLRYADQVAPLNSVLHPHSLLPAPRLALNRELIERKLLPLKVELRLDTDTPLQLVAEHEWSWKLSASDRQLISFWESQMASTELRRVPFREFQQEILSGEVANRR